MYRYTAKKNKQANSKLHQRQLSKRAKAAQSGKRVMSRDLTRQQGRGEVKKISQKAGKVSKKRVDEQWWSKEWAMVGQVVGSLMIMAALVGAIWWLLLNSFLPQIYRSSEEKTLLLVDAAKGERAERLYLVHLMPGVAKVEARELDGKMSVGVIGGYGQYPLGTLAPLLHFEMGDEQQIRAAYNFALNSVVDEVYFTKGVEIKTISALENWLSALIMQELKQQMTMRRATLDMYFAVREAKSFVFTSSSASGQAVLSGSGQTEDQLRSCPVVLMNAAGETGLAQKVEGLLTSAGLVVVRRDNASEATEAVKIYYDQTELDCGVALDRVGQILPQITESVGDSGEQAAKMRAKMVIVLGSQLAI